MKKALAIVLSILLVSVSLSGCSLVIKTVSGLLPHRVTASPVLTATPGDTRESAPSAEPAPTPSPMPEPTQTPTQLITTAECVSAGDYHTLGLRKDGTVVAAGDANDSACNVAGWHDIVAVSTGRWHSVGLMADGTVVAAGDNTYKQCDVSTWRNIISISAGDGFTVGLTADGNVVATGDNQKGECDVADWKGIVAISAGGWHTVGLRSDGTVVACGDNEYDQCDISSWGGITSIFAGEFSTLGLSQGYVMNTDTLITNGTADWNNTLNLANGSYHVVGLKADGTVVATGTNDKGQCNVSSWSNIVAISAGYQHTIGVKSDGTVVATGDNSQGQTNVQDWTNIGFPMGLPAQPAVSSEPVATSTNTAGATFKPTGHVLTIKTVKFKDISTLGDVLAVDENGKEVTLPADYSQWFDDATFESANIAAGGSFVIGNDGVLLGEDSKLQVIITVNGSKYSFQLGTGSQFNYTLEGGKIIITVDDTFTPVE